MTNGLIVAELTECFMGAQNQGWDCGGSNGETLSRFLAELESGGPAGALAAFATGPTWTAPGARIGSTRQSRPIRTRSAPAVASSISTG